MGIQVYPPRGQARYWGKLQAGDLLTISRRKPTILFPKIVAGWGKAPSHCIDRGFLQPLVAVGGFRKQPPVEIDAPFQGDFFGDGNGLRYDRCIFV